MDELKRLIPTAQIAAQCPDSGQSGCAAVSFATPEEQQTAVTVSYNMPLTFPLDLILGQNTVSIQATEEEMLERAAAGR